MDIFIKVYVSDSFFLVRGKGKCMSICHLLFSLVQNEGFEVKRQKSQSYSEGVLKSNKENESEQNCQTMGLAKNNDIKLKQE